MSPFDGINAEEITSLAGALCFGEDPALWQLDSPNDYRLPKTAEAKDICSRCPVRLKCLAVAMERNEEHGIWGGLTPKERQELRANDAA